jgi:hypothetical protein
MGDEIDLAELESGDALAWCANCDWTLATDMPLIGAQAMVVLHVLVRHPDVYTEVTGNDAETAIAQYADLLARPGVKEVL